MWLTIKKSFQVIFLLVAVYTVLRVAFYFIYVSPAALSFGEVVSMFYWGFRIDFTLLFFINLPFFIFHFFFTGQFSPSRSIIISILLLLINIPMLAIEFIDLVYYRYNLRRSNYDLLFVFPDSTSSFVTLLRTWGFVLLIFFGIAGLILFLQSKMLTYSNTTNLKRRDYLIFILFLVTGMLVARGGGARPILPSTPLLYFSPVYKPLVANSGITFLYSILKERRSLTMLEYFSEQE